ncbi:extensin-like [Copidosoma floridanum]|uniref:extensin-like n=1 Tax=Copidosoma floridanum TaxID=29053 RepID=UPI0006C96093|nr:extensin-like [Copidosoma floridanum]XP_014205617.1 extensin-like [Copidosoma floridanum]
MPRSSRYPPLPPISPVQLALVSSPPTYHTTRALPMSPAHTRCILLAAARPRYPVPYVALSPQPRSLSLALKLATAPREPGPLRLAPSHPCLIPTPKSKTLSRCPPLSFRKTCPCPLSRRCGNWRPSPPMPKFFSPAYPLMPRYVPEVPQDRLARAMRPEPRPVFLGLSLENHALKRRGPTTSSSRPYRA